VLLEPVHAPRPISSVLIIEGPARDQRTDEIALAIGAMEIALGLSNPNGHAECPLPPSSIPRAFSPKWARTRKDAAGGTEKRGDRRSRPARAIARTQSRAERSFPFPFCLNHPAPSRLRTRGSLDT